VFVVRLCCRLHSGKVTPFYEDGNGTVNAHVLHALTHPTRKAAKNRLELVKKERHAKCS
jgi:hypothetical protein